MIDRFYIALTNYADYLKKKGDTEKLEAVRHCYDLLQRAYDEGNRAKQPVTSLKPKDEIEAFVLSIPDIIVYYDTTDRTYFYELDRQHFDFPREVMNHLIDFRNHQRQWLAGKAKADLLRYISQKIKEIDSKVDCNKVGNNYVITKEKEENDE